MSDYLYLLLVSIKPELNQKFFQGTGLKHLQKPLLKDRPIYIPDFKELQIFNESATDTVNYRLYYELVYNIVSFGYNILSKGVVIECQI